jgi:hypothetical protein
MRNRPQMAENQITFPPGSAMIFHVLKRDGGATLDELIEHTRRPAGLLRETLRELVESLYVIKYDDRGVERYVMQLDETRWALQRERVVEKLCKMHTKRELADMLEVARRQASAARGLQTQLDSMERRGTVSRKLYEENQRLRQALADIEDLVDSIVIRHQHIVAGHGRHHA